MALTVTTAEADLVGSALLVAITVTAPAIAGAVYVPEGEILPDEAVHLTLLSAAVPCTWAVKGRVPVVIDEAEEGEMVIDVTAALGPGADTPVIKTVADADLLGSALLVAVTSAVPAFAGAV